MKQPLAGNMAGTSIPALPARADQREHREFELVALAKLGDAEAFAELIQRSRRMCLGAARSILNDPEEVEDQIQNAILKAWKNIGFYREDAKFSTWLLRIVVNQCLMTVRERKRRRTQPLEVESGEGKLRQVEIADGGPDPEQVVGSEQVTRLVREAIRRSPVIFRDVLRMADGERRPLAEVAGKLGISIAAAKTRLNRARRHLRQQMEKHLGRGGLRTLATLAVLFL